MRGFKSLYGAGPQHLLAHLGVFFISGWAIDQIVGGGKIVNWIAWFLGAALLHDLVLLPFYSLLDRGLTGWRRATGKRRHPWINYVRTPAAVAGILLLVYFPVILGKSSHNYRNDTGHALTGYTRNWLLITAGLFLFSALVYAVRHRPRRTTARRPARPAPARERPPG